MKAPSFTLKVLATALVLASTTGLAFAKNYKGEPVYKEAPPCPPPAMLKDGFYLGAQVGYDSYRIRESYGNHTTDFSSSLVGNVSGWDGGLFLGYGQYLTDMFYLGGEIFGTVNGTNQAILSVHSDDFNGQDKFQVNSSYGLALLPGLRLNDASLGYIRLGWNWANFKGKATGFDADSGVTRSSSNSNTSNGFNFGVGLETLIVTNWSVRTEFSHTWYNNFNGKFGVKFNPSDNSFMLGLIYHFA
jgi:opacity protein-like surface antigen